MVVQETGGSDKMLTTGAGMVPIALEGFIVGKRLLVLKLYGWECLTPQFPYRVPNPTWSSTRLLLTF